MSSVVDIVDAHDQPTGQAMTKGEAHSHRLPHRCVAVFVFDRQGRLLQQVHKATGALCLRDHSVGGHVDAGEDYHTAVYREAEEELGLKGEKFREIVTGLYSDEESMTHLFGIYECRPGKDWQFYPNEEVEELIPAAIEDIVQEMQDYPDRFTGGFRNTMRAYLDYTK